MRFASETCAILDNSIIPLSKVYDLLSDPMIHGLDRTQLEKVSNDDSTMNLTPEYGASEAQVTGIDNLDPMSKHMDTKIYFEVESRLLTLDLEVYLELTRMTH